MLKFRFQKDFCIFEFRFRIDFLNYQLYQNKIMPHKNFVGDDIITLNNAKIVQKNFTVLSKVNLNIKEELLLHHQENRLW